MDKAFLAEEIISAMRAHDKPRLSILRMIKNELDTQEKDSGQAVTDTDVVGALKRVLKQTSETLEGSIKAATDEERTALLQNQVDILTAYLPAQVTGADLSALVDQVLAEGDYAGKRDMGRAIAAVVERTGGNCDKAEVARLVGAGLS
ncbi:MAG: GatB/YqeY domain-containing protein [Coriobacteriia bacterium]|nr:GatB/YqeY domain-containing protein [Coriobacteriia bacterium]